MPQLLLLTANPKRKGAKMARRRRHHRRNPKRALPSQSAFGMERSAYGRSLRRNPKRRRRTGQFVAKARRTTHRVRRRASSIGRRLSSSNMVALLKNGAIGGAGALGVEVIMGLGQSVLPASVTGRVNADGTTNYLYYGTKAAVAVVLGTVGGKFLGGGTAAKLAEGSLTVSAYELMRGFMPAGVTLGRGAGVAGRGVGFMNPAQVLRGQGKIVPLQRVGNAGGIGNAGRIVPTASATMGSFNPLTRNR